MFIKGKWKNSLLYSPLIQMLPLPTCPWLCSPSVTTPSPPWAHTPGGAGGWPAATSLTTGASLGPTLSYSGPSHWTRRTTTHTAGSTCETGSVFSTHKVNNTKKLYLFVWVCWYIWIWILNGFVKPRLNKSNFDTIDSISNDIYAVSTCINMW